MAYITKQQLEEILRNAPPGTNPQEVMGKLLTRGNVIEGYTKPTPKVDTRDLLTKFTSGVTEFVGAKGISEQFGSDIARAFAPQDQKNLIPYPSMSRVAGSAIQSGANLIPGVKGAGLASKVAAGAGTGFAFDVGSQIQQGKPITPGIGTAVGAGFPIAGAALSPVKRILGGFFKGLASGLSGVPSKNIDTIIANPREAARLTQELAKSGNREILEQNAKTIVNGVSRVRQEARKSFGEGLAKLKQEDIKPAQFRSSIQPFLDSNGVSVSGKERSFTNVEFSDPKNLQRASNLIDDLSTVKLDGLSLRNLLNKVEDSRFRTATSDERLAFNAFLGDMAEAIKTAITDSTDKLGEINKAFSQDMQLTEAVQNIFGKVNYKNLPEIVRASQRLENLFNQKGLAPDVVDKFLTRIGIPPEKFKTSEAVRQISDKVTGTNAKGLSVSEIFQQTTSSVITPQLVRDLSVATGLAKQEIVPFLEKLQPAARNAVIQTLLQIGKTE